MKLGLKPRTFANNVYICGLKKQLIIQKRTK